ncbi:MAG TPA: glycosyltransferase family 9 protein [Gemmatimonadaceae bacterium]
MKRLPGTTAFLPQSFRQWSNLLLGRASEALRPLLKVAGRIPARGKITPPQEWRRGLIFGHNHMGDVLYRTGSLPILRDALPGCRWSFVTAPESKDLLVNNPHVEKVFAVQEGDNAWSMSFDNFVQLRSQKFDVALCSNSLRYYPDLAVAAALGIPNRVSFVHKGMSGLVTHPVPIEFPSAYAAYFRTIVASVTHRSPDWSLRPQVYLDANAANVANHVFDDIDIGWPVIACVLTTRQARGNWPRGMLLEVLRQARKQGKFLVAFCGSHGDAHELPKIVESYPHEKVIVAGRLSILPFAGFLARCTALLTLDSGPRHLGNAMGIPVIFARNMSHSQVEAGAYCDTEVDIAPSGDYLTDEQIQIAAADTPTRRGVNALLEVISRAQRA